MVPTIDPAATASLRLDDPDFSLLITHAAFELDRAAAGDRSTRSKAAELFIALEGVLPFSSSPGGAGPRYMDPDTLDVCRNTLHASGRHAALRTEEDVMDSFRDLLQEIQEKKDSENPQTLVELRGICIAFGNSLLTLRERQFSSHSEDFF